MGQRRGQTGNPNGRKKGVPNKVTAEAREAIAKFVDGNAHKLQEWLDQIAEDNPIKAFELFQSVIEYHVPKLARTEMQHLDENGKPSRPTFQVTVEGIKP